MPPIARSMQFLASVQKFQSLPPFHICNLHYETEGVVFNVKFQPLCIINRSSQD